MAPIQRDLGEVRRILARFTLERMLAGWSVSALADESNVHRSVIDRWENGRVDNPLLSVLAALVQPLDLRIDLVAERHVPLLNLDEFEIEALVSAAMDGWKVRPCDHPQEDQLLSALAKLRKVNKDGVGRAA